MDVLRDNGRFIDYFAVAGLKVVPLTAPSQGGPQGEQQDPNALTQFFFEPSKPSETDPLKTSFKADILNRYPLHNHDDAALPQHVWMFCFPNGIHLHTTRQPPTFFFFILTELDGSRFYGASLCYSEPLYKDTSSFNGCQFPPHMTPDPNTVYYAPTCLCLLSHHPYYSVHKQFLSYLYNITNTPTYNSVVPLERILSNFVETPLPPPGGLVHLMVGKTRVSTTRPARGAFPYVDPSISFEALFKCLGLDNTIKVFGLVLEERKILFTSMQYSLLTLAAEAISHLLYPFFWHHVFIPILPLSLADFLQAPTPFIVGMHAACYKSLHFHADAIAEVVTVDLDNGSIQSPFVPHLPSLERDELCKQLSQVMYPEVEYGFGILEGQHARRDDECRHAHPARVPRVLPVLLPQLSSVHVVPA
eukprot:TRINITY_DN10624_c0_g2_i2.p1 TRINITY_DN10624_c0_g2~~TRINITY_DN10624_c0_g2_i2.p1  ORF type:complete len:418 (-),score=93.87 TRINITY_DN10624_c0_g2_i2:893-2146(-)